MDIPNNPKEEQRKQVQKEIMSLSTAILAAAIIVAVAVLLAANLIINKFGTPSDNLAAVAGNTVDNNTVTKIASRVGEATEGTGKIIMYEFSDFQCPFCQNFWNTSYKQIKSKYIDTGKITFIYRHSPLPFHQNAQKSAEAAECANIQGKFWQYHDLLFINSKSDGKGLETTDLKKYAEDLELDTAKFNQCLDNDEMAKVVEEDSNYGKTIGINGTPTFYINGKQVVGALPFADFEKAIEEALK